MKMPWKEREWLTFAAEQACIPSLQPTLNRCNIFNSLSFSLSSVTGFDIDPDALEIAQENVLGSET
jgi:hypothetical protein